MLSHFVDSPNHISLFRLSGRTSPDFFLCFCSQVNMTFWHLSLTEEAWSSTVGSSYVLFIGACAVVWQMEFLFLQNIKSFFAVNTGIPPMSTLFLFITKPKWTFNFLLVFQLGTFLLVLMSCQHNVMRMPRTMQNKDLLSCSFVLKSVIRLDRCLRQSETDMWTQHGDFLSGWIWFIHEGCFLNTIFYDCNAALLECDLCTQTHSHTHPLLKSAFDYILCHQEVFAGSIWKKVLPGSMFIFSALKKSQCSLFCVCMYMGCVCVCTLHLDFSCNIWSYSTENILLFVPLSVSACTTW